MQGSSCETQKVAITLIYLGVGSMRSTTIDSRKLWRYYTEQKVQIDQSVCGKGVRETKK